MRHLATRERGHSLIEVMVAAGLFAIGALGLLRLIYSSAEGVTVAQKMTHASALARGKLDELALLPFDDAALTVGTYNDGTTNGGKNLGPAATPYASNGGGTGAFGAQDGWFTRDWVIAEPTAGFRTLTVTVKWWDGASKSWRQVQMAGARSQQ